MGSTMFKLNFNNGETCLCDPSDTYEFNSILEKLKSEKFQNSITAISIIRACGRAVKCPICKRSAMVSCTHCGSDIEGSRCAISTQYSMSRPRKCNSVKYTLEYVSNGSSSNGLERIRCFAGDMQITATVHHGQPSARVDIVKTGKIRFTNDK